ncbi:MAG: prepilin peptidase [Candidatus Izemoplasmataceae bacterium]
MDIVWYIYVTFIGLMLGSFYNVVGIRVPAGESLLGRSHCPKCGKTLGVIELLPVIGYLVLRGKCKECKSHISIKYPLIELISGSLFLLLFVLLRSNMVEYIVSISFVSLMLIVVVSDLYYQVVPDKVLLVFLPIIFVLRMFSDVMPWYESIIGGVLGFGFMYLIAWYGEKRFKKQALGGGDIKLYFIIGLFLGYNLVFLSLFFASVIGLLYGMIIRKKTGYIPFVPFIFVGSILSYLVGQAFIDWYLGILM